MQRPDNWTPTLKTSFRILQKLHPVRNKRGGGISADRRQGAFRDVPHALPRPHLASPWKADFLQPAGECHWHWASFKAKWRYLLMAPNPVGMRRVPGQGDHGSSHSALATHLNGPEGSPQAEAECEQF